MELIAKPSKTFALVVGIAEYGEDSWNIKSGATVKDALNFAKWLLSKGVPRENIKLCLSPILEDQKLLEDNNLEAEKAFQDNIVNIIYNLQSKEGDLLCIYWAGHGLIKSQSERRLLCADATKQSWKNIDLLSLQNFLNSKLFKIRNHICIIDACANYILETNGRPTDLGGCTFHNGQPMISQQFILLATKEGEKARVSDAEKTGYFSQAVLEALEKSPRDTFPPNMEEIANFVIKHVGSLKKNQRPTYLSYRNWDENKKEVYFDNFKNQLTKEEIRRLIKFLQDSGSVGVRDRRGLCEDLELKKPGSLPFINVDADDNFATRLINYLHNTKNQKAIFLLCKKLEEKFEDPEDVNFFATIKDKLNSNSIIS